jgi:putative Mn2+ efflux pump MntP
MRYMSSLKLLLIISIIGFLGGFIVPIFGTLKVMYWNNFMGGWLEFILFIIFEIICAMGLILGIKIYSNKRETKYGFYSIIIASLGLIINGFWLIVGLAAMSY